MGGAVPPNKPKRKKLLNVEYKTVRLKNIPHYCRIICFQILFFLFCTKNILHDSQSYHYNECKEASVYVRTSRVTGNTTLSIIWLYFVPQQKGQMHFLDKKVKQYKHMKIREKDTGITIRLCRVKRPAQTP